MTDYLQFLMKALAIVLLLPLAIWRLGGVHASLHSIPPELIHAHGGPYGWVYILSYALIVAISYNGSWSFAQKYYSVPDERSGRKAAYLAALLTFIGTPIMLLPALMARKLMPTFAVLDKPQDVYVHLIFELLPAGMIGIIVAALFSATMATVSADLNAIASVLTKDVYQRLLTPAASEKRLVAVGRGMTIVLGTCIVGISIWLGQNGRGSLFNIMVTAFGVLLAPTLLPLLATLVFRGLSSKGVITGFLAGMVCGLLTLTAKTLYIGHIGATDYTQALNFTLEGYSIFANIAATVLGMLLGSAFLKTAADEQRRTADFFRKLATPITIEESHIPRHQSNSSSRIVRLSTLAVGLLLLLSGALTTTSVARRIDMTIGLVLALLAVPVKELFGKGESMSQPGRRNNEGQWLDELDR